MNEGAFSSWTPLQTARLQLRQLSLQDAFIIYRLRTDENVNAMIGRKPPASIDGAIDFINGINKSIQERNAFYWGIYLKEQLIGTICLFDLNAEKSSVETGFELLPEFRGHGYMQESFEAVRDFVFHKLLLKNLLAVVNVINENSIALLKKNGFRITGKIEIEKPEDHYSMILENPALL